MFSVSDESERRRKEAGERARRESRDKEKRQREEKSGDEIEIKIYAGKEPKNEGTKERTEERNGEIGTGDIAFIGTGLAKTELNTKGKQREGKGGSGDWSEGGRAREHFAFE